MALDKFGAWIDEIDVGIFIIDNPEMDRLIQQNTGLLIITFHIGNMELCRVLSKSRDNKNITIFAHTEHARKLNDLISRFRQEATIEVVEVKDINPGTVVDLKRKLAKGEWVIIAADRISVEGNRRVSEIDFLGKPALFNQGPILLAAMFKCPVYLMVCMREGNYYRICFELFRNPVRLPRHERNAAIVELQRELAAYLEQKCREYPDQWFNFFDFWSMPGAIETLDPLGQKKD